MTNQNVEGGEEVLSDGEPSSAPVIEDGGDTTTHDGDDVDDGGDPTGSSTTRSACSEDGGGPIVGRGPPAAEAGGGTSVSTSSSSPSPSAATRTTITPSSPDRDDGAPSSSTPPATAATASGRVGDGTPITGREFIHRLLMQQQQQQQRQRQQQGQRQAGSGTGDPSASGRPNTVRLSFRPRNAEEARRIGEALAAQRRLQQQQQRQQQTPTTSSPPPQQQNHRHQQQEQEQPQSPSGVDAPPPNPATSAAGAVGVADVVGASSSATSSASGGGVPRPSSSAGAATSTPMKMRSGFLLSSPKKSNRPGGGGSSSRGGKGTAGAAKAAGGGGDTADSPRVDGDGGTRKRETTSGAGVEGRESSTGTGGEDDEESSSSSTNPRGQGGAAGVVADGSSSTSASASAAMMTNPPPAAPDEGTVPVASFTAGGLPGHESSEGVGVTAPRAPYDDGTGDGRIADGLLHQPGGGGLSVRLLGRDGSIIFSPPGVAVAESSSSSSPTTTTPVVPAVAPGTGSGGAHFPAPDPVPTDDDGGDGDATAVEESSSSTTGETGSTAASSSLSHSHAHTHNHSHAHGHHHHHHHHHHGHGRGRGRHQPRRGPTTPRNGGGTGPPPRVLINGVPVPVTVRRGPHGGGVGPGGSNDNAGVGPPPRVVVNGVPVVQNPQHQQRWQQMMRQQQQRGPGGAGAPSPSPQVVTQQVQIHLPPLVAQPVPHHQQQQQKSAEAAGKKSEGGSSDGDVDDDDAKADDGAKGDGAAKEDTKKAADDAAAARQAAYACSICLDCMDDPAGCGNCSNRFCYTCLERVARGGGSGGGGTTVPPSNNDRNGNGAKCPCCRSALSVNSIVRDDELRERMDDEDLAPCPNPGCDARLKLSALKKHESSCPHVIMRCKYAPFGCRWTGTRGELEGRHDVVDDVGGCPYGRVGGLVDHLRLTRAVHDQQINHLQQQVVAANRLVHIQGNTLVSLQSKSVDNVFDILTLVHLSLCHSLRFLMTKDLWRQLHGTPETRGAVFNFLYLVPTLVFVIKICLSGVRLCFFDGPATFEGEGEFLDYVDQVLLSVLVCVLSIFVMTCFRIDGTSALSWKSDRIWRNDDHTVFRDAAASCLMMIISCGIERYESSWLAGFVVWCFLSVATVVVPPAIAPILETASGQTAERGGVGAKSARARSVVLFGLRYGLLQSLFGILPAFNAIALLRLIKCVYETLRKPKVLPNWITQEDGDCFLSEVGFKSWSFLTVASVAATLAFEWPDGPTYFLLGAVEVVHYCGALVFINSFVHILEILGENTGKRLASTTLSFLARRMNNAADGVVKAGSALYCCWLVCLACVVIS